MLYRHARGKEFKFHWCTLFMFRFLLHCVFFFCQETIHGKVVSVFLFFGFKKDPLERLIILTYGLFFTRGRQPGGDIVWHEIIELKEDYAGIPWCNADELYYQVDLVTWSFINMELLEENASVLSDSPLLYFHCLDFDSQSYIGSSNLACCRFLTVLGHVSFPKELRERRLCLFVNTSQQQVFPGSGQS